MSILQLPTVTRDDIEQNARDAQRYLVAYERIMLVLDNPKLSREEMCDLLARDYAAAIGFYQEGEG